MSSTDAITPVTYHFECADFDWRVRAIVVEERLSQPLCAELRLLTSAAVTPEDVLGVAARVSIERDGAMRTFVGEVTRVETSQVASGETHARIRFEPLLARARSGVHYRIFQRTPVVDIVKDVLGPIADCDFEVRRQANSSVVECNGKWIMHGAHSEGVAGRRPSDGHRWRCAAERRWQLGRCSGRHPVYLQRDPEGRTMRPMRIHSALPASVTSQARCAREADR